MTKELLQWHPAFFAAFQAEIREDAQNIMFINEFQLGTKPKEIDVLAVKKDRRYQCQRDITRFFRLHNIVEYKHPDKSLRISDYYKVMAYASFYVAEISGTSEILPSELTVTFVCNHYPRELMKHLSETQHVSLKQISPGIFELNKSWFPVQIIIIHELDPSQYLWLYSLRNNLTEKELLAILKNYEEHKDNTLYQSAMDLIIRANWEKVKEMKLMCQALDELFADKYLYYQQLGEEQGRRIGEEQGRKNHLISLIRKKLARNKTPEEIADALEEDVAIINSYIAEIKEEPPVS